MPRSSGPRCAISCCRRGSREVKRSASLFLEMMPAMPHITSSGGGATREEIAKLRVERGLKALSAEFGNHLRAEKIGSKNIGMRMPLLQDRDDGIAELGRIIRVDEESEFAIAKRIGRPVLIARQNRLAAGQRLEKDNAETLAPAWHGEEIAKVVVRAEFLPRDIAGES